MASTEPAAPRRALLDVNVLIALHDEQHVHHEAAARWFIDQARHGWASCPLTQNGCIRIMSQPGYPNPAPIGDALTMLVGASATQNWTSGALSALYDGDPTGVLGFVRFKIG